MRTQSSVPLQPGMFRSPLAPAAAVFLALGAVLGLGSVLALADPGYFTALTEKILRSGIRTASALNAWALIHIVITLLCFICPAVTVWGMFRVSRGEYAKGLNLLADAAKWLRITVHLSAAVALAMFLFRAGRYLFGLMGRQDWIYQLFASVVMEGLMVVQAVFLYRLLVRFLEDCEGCAASMGYSLSSGKVDSGAIPAFAATGLLILGIVCIALSVDRLVTMTIASDGFKQYYKLLLAAHPGQWCAAGALLFGGIGDILLSRYVKFYSRTAERAVFFAGRNP